MHGSLVPWFLEAQEVVKVLKSIPAMLLVELSFIHYCTTYELCLKNSSKRVQVGVENGGNKLAVVS